MHVYQSITQLYSEIQFFSPPGGYGHVTKEEICTFEENGRNNYLIFIYSRSSSTCKILMVLYIMPCYALSKSIMLDSTNVSKDRLTTYAIKQNSTSQDSKRFEVSNKYTSYLGHLDLRSKTASI